MNSKTEKTNSELQPLRIPADWRELDRDHLIHPLHNCLAHENPHLWVRGEGSLLYDEQGREFIDALSGLWNVAAGHGRRELAAAAAEQMSRLAYCSGYIGSSNPAAIELAEKLAAITYPL